MQAGKFLKINKRAGCNKAVQDVIFQESIVKKPCRLQNTQKLINVQDVIRPCRLYFFQKLIRTCSTFIRQTRVPDYVYIDSLFFGTFKLFNSEFTDCSQKLFMYMNTRSPCKISSYLLMNIRHFSCAKKIQLYILLVRVCTVVEFQA